MDRMIQRALYEAALAAAREMGSDLLNMSCFYSNWAEMEKSAEEELLQAA